jgi:hypothetical protein
LKNEIKKVILISGVILVAYFVFTYLGLIDWRYFFSVMIATSFAFINFSIFLISYKLGFKKKSKIFVLFTFGSMLVRLFLMIIAIFLSIKFLKVDLVAFIFAFFIWYIILLFFEILIVQRGIGRTEN